MVEFTTRPLYLQVRDELWDRIAKGAWKPGFALPNEFLLAQELKISIGTVRKAVDELVAEKAVSRQQGRGTFVIDRKSSQFRRDFDRLRNIDGSAIDWRYLHLDVSVSTPGAEERRLLALTDPDADVYRLTRVRETDGRIAVVEYCALPRSLFTIDDSIPGVETTLVFLAEKNGIFPSTLREMISVESAGPDLAEQFEVAVGTPLMKLDRVVFDIYGRPIEWRIAYCDLRGQHYYAEHTTGASHRAPKANAMCEA